MPGRNLEVVTEFEILREGKSLSGGDVSKGFEVVHRQSISSNPRTTNLPVSMLVISRSGQTHEFSQNVHGNLQTSDGSNDPHWNNAKGAEDDTVDDNSRSGVRLPQPNTKTTTQDGEAENGEIPDLSDIRVDRHESIVDIGESGHSTTSLEDSLESHCTDVSFNLVAEVGDLHFTSVVEVGIGYDGSVGGKEPEVDGDITSRHVGGRVGFVLLLIKDTSAIGDVEDVVGFSKSVEGSVPTCQPLT